MDIKFGVQDITFVMKDIIFGVTDIADAQYFLCIE